MIARWLYNRISSAATKEDIYMNLDSVLEKMGTTQKIQLLDNHPSSVSVSPFSKFYIKPTLKDINIAKDPKMLLFSAPGATGKSALAQHISRSKNALLWDLSKEKIANHSFSGMLVESLGTKLFSEFTEGLENGTAVLVIDALDEAEMISGRIAIETLLKDLRSICENATSPNIALCARTETAHFIKEFYSNEETKLAVSHYEVSFFEETNAIDFIKEKISEKRTLTPAAEEWIKAQFSEIKRILGNDQTTIKSFIGYAPVLEALAVFFDEESNTMTLLQKTATSENSTDAFCEIMEYILDREQKKVISGFKERCEKDFPLFDGWDSVYTFEEQIIRIADYLIFGASEYETHALSLPKELCAEYNECVQSFLKDHPFIQTTTHNETAETDFTGAAFRDYVLAKLMHIPGYDVYAKEYFSNHKQTTRCPSRLFFDFYACFSDGTTTPSHFTYLYDSYKAREQADTLSKTAIVETPEAIYFTFEHQSLKKGALLEKTEFTSELSQEPISIIQLNNTYIDILGNLLLGGSNEDVIISNSTLKCKKAMLASPCIMLVAQNDGGSLIALSEGFEIYGSVSPKFELRVDQAESLKVSSPDIHDWYKLLPYKYDLNDETNIDIIKFENAVKTILKHFRKHGKDAPGRHFEFIKNIIIGGSDLKQNIHDFFISRSIIYQDSKDPRQYKLDISKLEVFGINWGHISQNSTPDFKQLFDEYSLWKSSKK